MPQEFSRNVRVAEQIQRELGHLLQFEVKDPRVRHVTIVAVTLDRDMAHAKVFYSTPKSDAGLQRIFKKLAGFLRTQLAQRMLLRTVPTLTFSYDSSLDYAGEISKLIACALRE